MVKQPKMGALPYLLFNAKLWRCINHHSTPANKTSMISENLSLEQVMSTYHCLVSMIKTKHLMKQPKKLLHHIVVVCQAMKMHQPPQHSSLTGGDSSKYIQLVINVQFLLLRQYMWWSSQRNCFIAFVVKHQTIKMNQMQQHSFNYGCPD